MSKATKAATWALGLVAMGLVGMLLAGDAIAGMGQPSDRQMGLQEPVTAVMREIKWFHDTVNIVICLIALFVLVLLALVIVRFNERANPVPSRTTHNAGLEVAWTVLPIFILIGIAVPSFKMLFHQYTYPKPDLVLKAVGNQWNWTHSYPDHAMADGKPVSFTSFMLNETSRDVLVKKGIPAPRLLAVDNEVFVPVNKVVHVIVTSSDVIHNWTIPSFGSKVDAVPGRTTATWFKAEREGVFYGQCSELCGKDHAFMPIAVRVVKDAVFNEWIAARKARDRDKIREIQERLALEHAKLAGGGSPVPVAAAVPAR